MHLFQCKKQMKHDDKSFVAACSLYIFIFYFFHFTLHAFFNVDFAFCQKSLALVQVSDDKYSLSMCQIMATVHNYT